MIDQQTWFRAKNRAINMVSYFACLSKYSPVSEYHGQTEAQEFHVLKNNETVKKGPARPFITGGQRGRTNSRRKFQ